MCSSDLFPSHDNCVTTADKTDRQGALDAITIHRDTLQNVEVVLVDGGYTGEPFYLAVKNLIRARVEVAKRSELHNTPKTFPLKMYILSVPHSLLSLPEWGV